MDILQIVRERVKRKYSGKSPKPSKPNPEKKADEEFFCSQCRLKFSSEKELKKHRRKYHTPQFGMK